MESRLLAAKTGRSISLKYLSGDRHWQRRYWNWKAARANSGTSWEAKQGQKGSLYAWSKRWRCMRCSRPGPGGEEILDGVQ